MGEILAINSHGMGKGKTRPPCQNVAHVAGLSNYLKIVIFIFKQVEPGFTNNYAQSIIEPEAKLNEPRKSFKNLKRFQILKKIYTQN